MTELPIQGFLLETVDVLDCLAVPYMIMGGFAVRSWGVPRPTYDADLAVAVDDEGMTRLLAALEAAGFDVPPEHKKGFRDTVAGMKKVKASRFEDGTTWDIDLFIVQDGLLASALQRRRRQALEGHDIWVMAPEDVILLKLIAFRRKDQLDIEEILKISSGLDQAYLKQWVLRLGLSERWAEFE